MAQLEGGGGYGSRIWHNGGMIVIRGKPKRIGEHPALLSPTKVTQDGIQGSALRSQCLSVKEKSYQLKNGRIQLQRDTKDVQFIYTRRLAAVSVNALRYGSNGHHLPVARDWTTLLMAHTCYVKSVNLLTLRTNDQSMRATPIFKETLYTNWNNNNNKSLTSITAASKKHLINIHTAYMEYNIKLYNAVNSATVMAIPQWIWSKYWIG
jgi:hypothetical protein